jgi:hypothetical protein
MVFPYLKGFEIIKCGFFYIALWIYCVFSICGDSICRSILDLNKWYQSTFLGRKCGQIFLFFADLFFRKKKRVVTLWTISLCFYENFEIKGCISEFLS